MGKTLDAIRKAEKDRLISRKEMGLFETKGTSSTERWEAGRTPVNGNGIIPVTTIEEYNQLKQSITILLPHAKPRCILFASASEDEGNSAVVANFGRVLATIGERVLLVDVNLRNPVLHERFEIERSPGMSELLSDQEVLGRVISPTLFPNMSLVPAGTPPSNPFSLFAHGTIDSLVHRMKAEVDWLLFDAPAVNAFNDAVILGGMMDGVVLVVRAGKTRWEVARNARQRLESGKANILGVVLSDRKLHIPGWIYRRL